MPETPTLNSVRMQRAQRINSIEESRLQTRLYLMNKEKRHQMRMAQQDMRMVNLTLDYIQSSSGYSPEALPPDYVEPHVEKEPEACFMYGERLRRWKQSRRVQSAPSMSRRHSNVDSENTQGAAVISLSEAQQKGWGSAQFSLERIREFTREAEKSKPIQVKIRPKTSVPKEGFVTEVSLAHANKTHDELSEAAIKAMTDDIQKSLETSRQELDDVKQERKHLAHGRKAAITQAVNKVRVMATTAKRMKNVTPMQALVKPPTKTIRQKNAWEEKLSINSNRNQKLEAKLKIFMTSYPTHRTSSIEV